MADYYTSALAAGGGAGTIGSPWTWAEMIAFINASAIAGDHFHVKADGTYNAAQYTITKNGLNTAALYMEGYTTTPGDDGLAIVLRASGAGTLATHSGTFWQFKNISWDGGGLGTGVVGSASSHFYIGCKVRRGGTLGNNGGGIWINCVFENNGLYGAAAGAYFNCHAINNGTNGFASPVIVDHCIVANNGSYGISLVNNGHVTNSVVNANAGGGITATAPIVFVKNTIISNHGAGQGINFALTGQSHCFGCDFYNNTSDTNAPSYLLGKKTLDPQFTNPLTYDYRRAGSFLDGQGYSMMGRSAFDYEMAIGPSPKVLGGAAPPTFAGITGLVSAAEGCLIASWAAATNAEHYEVFIQPGTATGLFTAANKVLDIDAISPGRYSAKLKTEGDGTTVLDGTVTYFVGVKAQNSAGTDSNTVSLSAVPSNNIYSTLNSIKTKTDNLPADPADASDIAAAFSATPAAVWAYGTRTLSDFGTLVSDVWAYTVRTITSGGITAAQIWTYITRTLTSGGGGGTTIVNGRDVVGTIEADHEIAAAVEPNDEISGIVESSQEISGTVEGNP